MPGAILFVIEGLPMPNPITIHDVRAYVAAASPDELEQIEKLCRSHIKHQRDLANLVGVGSFHKDQRVRVNNDVGRKYSSRLGTVTEVKQKRIFVQLDLALFETHAPIVGFLAEHLTIVKPGEEIGTFNRTMIPVTPPSPQQPQFFSKNERVRISDSIPGKWSGVEGVVVRQGAVNVTVDTSIGGVRVRPEFLTKL
jgi:hypothetical protein